MIRRSLASALTVAFAASAPSLGAFAAERVLTLHGALRAALEAHPSLAIVRANERAQEARVEEAKSGYLPSFGYNFGYTRRTANCVNQPGSFPCSSLTARPSGFDTFNFWQAGISIVQPIWDFGRTSEAHDAARIGVRAAKEQQRATRFGVALDVKLAYYAVLAQQELIKVAEDAFEQQRKHLVQAEGFFSAGTKTRIDVVQAKADVANAELALIKARNNLVNTKSTLLGAMGDASSNLEFRVEPATFPALAEEALSTESLTDRALENRADIRALETSAAQSEANIRVAKSNFWPQIQVQVGPTFAGTELLGLSTNFAATISLTVPTGATNYFYTYHQLSELHAVATGAKATAAKLRNDVRTEIRNARTALRSAMEAIVAAEKALVAAKERLELAEGRYQAGTGTMIELSDAQAVLTQAKATRVQADYDIAVARAQLTKALGRE